MGTNYYWREVLCVHCKNTMEVHVGKSSGTWRAYPHELMDKDHPDWGYQLESPFGFPILSIADWRRVFKTRPGELWTEYKELIPDPLAWLAEKKPWKPGPDGMRYFEEELRHGNGWIDAEGYKFYSGEFC